MQSAEIFEARESAARSYCRLWPVVFDRADGCWMYDEDNTPYLDFFAGLVFEQPELAGKVSRAAFERGLLVETSGSRDEVVKLLPPLTITDQELDEGLDRLADAVGAVC